MILSILGMGLTALVFQEIKFSSSFSRLVSSLPVAQAAVKAIFYDNGEKKDTNNKSTDSGKSSSKSTSSYDTLKKLAEEKEVVLCDGVTYKYYFVDKKKTKDGVEIIDESALININTATKDMLERLPGLNEDLADKIVNSGLRPFKSINEVMLVEDMTADKFRLFKDLVTVYGNGKININTANRGVLKCLGLDDELIDVIERFRKEHKIEKPMDFDEPIESESDYGFSSVSTLATDLNSFSMIGLRQEQDLISLQSRLDVRSDYRRLNIVPKINNKEGTRFSVVVNLATKKILSWKEN